MATRVQRYVKAAIFGIFVWLGLKTLPFIARARLGTICPARPEAAAVGKALLVTMIRPPVTVTETTTISVTVARETVTVVAPAVAVPVSGGVRRAASTKLSHLVIPMPFKETQLLRLNRSMYYWHQNPPCLAGDIQEGSGQRGTALIFLLSQPVTEEREGRIREIYDSLGATIHACFSSWAILSAHVPHHLDNHFDGSRSMLEALLDNRLNLPDLHYVFWMEPDTLPIQPNWLRVLQQNTDAGTEEFWIRGSALRHDLDSMRLRQRYGNHFLYHINGNAIYNMARDQYPAFYQQTLLPYMKAKGPARFAFDLAVAQFLQDGDNYKVWQTVAHRFQHTGIIQNRWREVMSLDEFAQSFPETYLVHGAIPRLAPNDGNSRGSSLGQAI